MKHPALILYIIATIFYVLSNIMGWEVMQLVSQSLVLPSILIHYILKRYHKVDLLVIIICILFFIGDIIIQTKPENSLLWILLIYVFIYIIFLYFVFKDFIQSKVNFRKLKINKIFLIIFLLSFIYLLCIDLILYMKIEYSMVYILCGFLIFLICSLTNVFYYLDKSVKNYYLVITGALFAISDLFFLLQYFYVEYEYIKFLTIITQSGSYFFLINYFLEHNKLKDNKF